MIIRDAVAGILASLVSSAMCFAGILSNHPSSVLDVDGNPASGSFTDQFINFENVLDASVDYAVFRANDFVTLFPNSGFTPVGSLVYTYQVFVNDPSSTLGVGSVWLKGGSFAAEPAPSWFNTAAIGGDQAPQSAEFSSTQAKWMFPDLSSSGMPDFTIDPGESSWGLVFSSNNAPVLANNVLQVFPELGRVRGSVHVPGTQLFIPEPTTCTLALAALCLAMSRRRAF